MSIIREFGSRARIQISANENGTISVEIWGHDALSSPGNRWNWRDDNGQFWLTVEIEELAGAIAEANAAADRCIEEEAAARGAVAVWPAIR